MFIVLPHKLREHVVHVPAQIGFPRLQKHVKMIAHHNIRMNFNIKLARIPKQRVKKRNIVLIRNKYIPLFVAAIVYMIPEIFRFYAQWAWHVITVFQFISCSPVVICIVAKLQVLAWHLAGWVKEVAIEFA